MLFTIIKIVIVVVLVIGLFLSSYVKAPPDTAYVISGLKQRILKGKAGIRIPFLERVDKLSLQMVSVDVKTNEPVPTVDFIDVIVDSVVKIKLGTTENAIAKASENFLNMDIAEISAMVKDVLEGNLREVIGSINLRDLITDRKSFAAKVQENAVPDLERMGLVIISFNIQAINDQADVISNLGIENTSQIKKTASISRAIAEKDVAIAESKADKEANDARIASDLEIFQKNTDLEIKKANLKRETEVQNARANAAYKIEEEEQRKEIETKTQEANIIKQEKEIELATKEAEVKEQKLIAEVNKTANAERYKLQQQADANLYTQQKVAEADLFMAQKEAEASNARASAKRFAEEEEAKAIEAMGLAEATAIEAKGLAEAKGIDARAEALKKYDKAAIAEMYFKSLPEVMASAAAPLSKIDSITMYGEGNSTKMVGDIVNTVAQVSDGVLASTGLDLKSMLNGFIGGKIAQPKDDLENKPTIENLELTNSMIDMVNQYKNDISDINKTEKTNTTKED
jgi:flotillin